MNNEFEYHVKILLSSKTATALEMSEWAEEHNMPCVYKILHSEGDFGRPNLIGFDFKFLIEDDAAAFKLRWI